MSRVAHSTRSDGAGERIRQAAIALFSERGYYGTSLRDLARRVRIEAGSLYYHFPSKQDLLSEVLQQAMAELLEGAERASAGSGSPADRLAAAVRFHVRYHAQRRAWAFVSRSELRSLSAGNLRKTLVKRDRYEAIFRSLIVEGVATGTFAVPDVGLCTLAILTMCSSVAEWFSDKGRLSADEVADRYAEMVLRIVSGSVPP